MCCCSLNVKAFVLDLCLKCYTNVNRSDIVRLPSGALCKSDFRDMIFALCGAAIHTGSGRNMYIFAPGPPSELLRPCAEILQMVVSILDQHEHFITSYSAYIFGMLHLMKAFLYEPFLSVEWQSCGRIWWWPWIRSKMAPLKSAKCSLITKCGVAIHKCHVYMSPCASSNRIFEVKMCLSWINRQWRVMLWKRCSPYFSISKMKPFSFWVEVKQSGGGQREITLLWMRHLHTSPTFTLHVPLFYFCSIPLASLKSSPTSKQTRRDVKLRPVLR